MFCKGTERKEDLLFLVTFYKSAELESYVWRIPLGLQIVPSLILAVTILFCPFFTSLVNFSWSRKRSKKCIAKDPCDNLPWDRRRNESNKRRSCLSARKWNRIISSTFSSTTSASGSAGYRNPNPSTGDWNELNYLLCTDHFQQDS